MTIAALLAAIAVVSAVRSRSQEAKDAALSTELISAVYEGNRATCAQASAAAIGLPRTCSRRKPV